MKNKLTDLNNHLFLQLERLNDEALEGEALQKEIERTKALTQMASSIVSNARIVLDAEKLRQESFSCEAKLPPMLDTDK